MNSIQAEFAKIKTAQIEAEEGMKTKKKKPVEIEESPAEALHGFKLQLGDEEGDEEGEDESDDDEMDKVPTAATSMPNLALISNGAFKAFTEKAVGRDAEELADQERRRKKQRERKGKLFPNDGEIFYAETGRTEEVNYTSWIHPKDAPDEYKTTKVLGALGKFKKNLTGFRMSQREGEGASAKGQRVHPPAEQPNFPSLAPTAAVEPPPPQPQQPASDAEVDWEAKAAVFLESAISEDATGMIEGREEVRRKVRGGRAASWVIFVFASLTLLIVTSLPPPRHLLIVG
jgi:hypothetical protein